MCRAICPNPHPHGAVYAVQRMENGALMCPWCDWDVLMQPVPGQYVAFPRGIDPYRDPEKFRIEREARKERDLETRQNATQKLKERAAHIKRAGL